MAEVKKILVTGASGFLGSHILEAAHEKGFEVHALVRPNSSREWLGHEWLHFHTSELTDRKAITAILGKVEYVIHSAGVMATTSRNERDSQRTNVEATQMLAEESISAGIKRFVFASSLAAGGPGPGPQARTENDPDCPVSHYGRSKLDAELMLKSLSDKLSFVSLRFSMIYGPRDHNILGFFKTLEGNLVPVMGYKPLYNSMIYVKDAASAAVKALSADVTSGSVYQITDGQAYTLEGLYDNMEEALGKGKKAMRIKIPFWLVMLRAWWLHDIRRVRGISPDQVRQFRSRYWYVSPDKAIRELGWEPKMDIMNGLVETVEWYRRQGWL
ncbi:NAD(P)-dependent oxidoreductase [candidate division WOR-3 bacterium]|nr:NAD(P)-dependent oxidoreductase [candidate division WOR-3 bacterium]